MFADRYKKAYDTVAPSRELLEEVLHDAEAEKESFHEKGKKGRGKVWYRRMAKAAAAAAVVVCIFSALPVCAAEIPAFYRVIEYLSPVLADRLVPIEKSSSSKGITMAVEAIDLEGNEAEIIVSVRDDEDSTVDRIHGQVDLFDSYDLKDYGGTMQVGGCSYLTYDAETDAAYFKITTQTDGTYQADKLFFSVREILCNKTKENRTIDLPQAAQSVKTKQVSLNGMGGIMEPEQLPESLRLSEGTEEDPREQCSVLDLMPASDCAADDFTVTGVVYMDNILRLQICMGDNSHADRHVQPFLVNADGEERNEDYNVGWEEKVGEASYHFNEYWFIGELEDLQEYSMYGIFHDVGDSVEGDWKVVFRIE